jgi:hypothetical protein
MAPITAGPEQQQGGTRSITIVIYPLAKIAIVIYIAITVVI